jgi:glycosyltransferase involved in cell wall biosynthesis
MAAGIPLILSPLDAYKDYLKDEENCFYIEKITSQALTEKVNYVLNNYDWITGNFTSTNQMLVKENYNFERQMEVLISVYNE